MKLKPYLNQHLTRALNEQGFPLVDFQLAPSRNPEFGDLSTNVALLLAKPLRQNPMTIAELLIRKLNLDPAVIAEVTSTKPGFINFRIAPDYLYLTLSDILKCGPDFGKSSIGKGKTANVEFVSANPTGPLTVGHGRQAVLGDTISNILEWHGYTVTREYYYNDAGRQMRLLGQSVAARYQEELGRAATFPEDGYQGGYIRDIARDILNAHGSDLKEDSPRFRKTAEETIFRDIRTSLESLGINHAVFSNEKTFYDSGAIDAVIRELTEIGLVYQSEGATWFKTTDLGVDQDRVLIKSTGEPTYRLPDIAYHRNKLERGFDLIIDIFGADHQDTYPDIISALAALGYQTGSIRVLIHQFVTLIRGGEVVKMSTRKANYVTLEELTRQVGRDVVRYFFIMRGMTSHLNFDLDLAMDQSEKNPVYYLQYAHARIAGILKHDSRSRQSLSEGFDPGLLVHSSELTLLKTLAEYPDAMQSALETLEPQVLANYLHELAGHFHRFYTDCRVITPDAGLTRARLGLILGTKTVMASGLNVLGIQAPERM